MLVDGGKLVRSKTGIKPLALSKLLMPLDTRRNIIVQPQYTPSIGGIANDILESASFVKICKRILCFWCTL